MWFHGQSGWVLLAFVVYGIICALSCGAFNSSKTPAGGIAAFFGTFVGLVLVVNLASFGLAHSYQPQEAGAADAAKVFGLESGKTYPLVLGERLGGTVMTVSASAGFFSARASASGKPASSVSVSFTHGSNSYILDLPTSQITFHQSKTAPPTIAIYLNKNGDYGTMVTKTHPCNKLGIESGFMSCRRIVTHVATPQTLGSAQMRRGLGPIVQEGGDSFVVTLRSDQYERLVGVKNG